MFASGETASDRPPNTSNTVQSILGSMGRFYLLITCSFCNVCLVIILHLRSLFFQDKKEHNVPLNLISTSLTSSQAGYPGRWGPLSAIRRRAAWIIIWFAFLWGRLLINLCSLFSIDSALDFHSSGVIDLVLVSSTCCADLSCKDVLCLHPVCDMIEKSNSSLLPAKLWINDAWQVGHPVPAFVEARWPLISEWKQRFF